MMEMVRREAITVVYVTHDQAEAMAVSDRIAVMRAGEIAQFDTPGNLRSAGRFPRCKFYRRFFDSSGQVRDELFKVEDSDAETVRTPGARSGAGMLVVRPEDARPAEAHPGNRLQGSSVECFPGPVLAAVNRPGAQQVRLDWPEAPPVGASLAFSLPPERCVVLTA